jgi:hypothetical protein
MATTFLEKKNNAKTTITNNPLTAGGLSITLASSSGAKFPTTTFLGTLWDAVTYSDPGDDPAMEVVLCDSRSSDTVTVNASGRGYAGTSAVEHATGSAFRLLIMKEHMTEYETAINTLEGSVNQLSMPWMVDIDPFQQAFSITNWQAGLATSSNSITNGAVGGNSQNDEITYKVMLSAGTWSVWLMSDTNLDRGIITFKLDTVSIGTLDCYSALQLYNAQQTFSFTVSTGGIHTLQLITATKNASSSGYFIRMNALRLLRTA